MQTFSDQQQKEADQTAKGLYKPRRNGRKKQRQVNTKKIITHQRQAPNNQLNNGNVLIEPNLFDKFLPNVAPKK